MSAPLLEVSGLHVAFRARDGELLVLRDVALRLEAGRTLCLVGESGSGKSMTALAIMGLLPAPAGWIRAGSVRLAGEELVGADAARLRRLRGKEVAMIFQEPMTALNPVFSIGEQIAETLRLHEGMGRRAARERALQLLVLVGIPDPGQRLFDYPHQLSGGLRQRAMIAMALACNPKLLIADEPTTALDVTVQAQILNLLQDLQRRLGTAILLITHDMGVVAEIADEVVVMYAGRAVERGPAAKVLAQPMHPYTQALIACAPRPRAEAAAERRLLDEIPGVVPSMRRLPPGCSFAPRCRHAFAQCVERPPEIERGSGRAAACWLLS